MTEEAKRELTEIEVKAIEFSYYTAFAADLQEGLRRLKELMQAGGFQGHWIFGLDVHDEHGGIAYGLRDGSNALLTATGLPEEKRKDMDLRATSIALVALEDALSRAAHLFGIEQIRAAEGFLPEKAVQDLRDAQEAFEKNDPHHIYLDRLRKRQKPPEDPNAGEAHC